MSQISREVAAMLLLSVGLCAGERVVEVSSYCPCRKCCGKWAGGPTTSGRMPKQGRTIACNWLPFGTRIHIEGVGERVVEDRLSPKFGHRIDLFLTSHDAAKGWGVRTLKVTVKQPTK